MTIQLKTLTWLSLAIALSAGPIFGCGDDSGDDDDTGGSGSGSHLDGGGGKGSTKDGGGGDDTKDGGGGKGGSGGKGSAGKGGSKVDGGGGTAPDGGTCEGADGCYACDEKTTDEQFLNQCSDSDSEEFDNAKRIKYEVGGKPWKPGDDLPEVI